MNHLTRNIAIDSISKDRALTDQMAENNRLRELQHAASRRADRNNGEVMKLKNEKEALEKQLAQKEALLQEKEKLILEWMLSNEAFNKLAKEYGKELGMNQEERSANFQNAVLDIAEENPKFSDTNLAKGIKAKLNM